MSFRMVRACKNAAEAGKVVGIEEKVDRTLLLEELMVHRRGGVQRGGQAECGSVDVQRGRQEGRCDRRERVSTLGAEVENSNVELEGAQEKGGRNEPSLSDHVVNTEYIRNLYL